MKLKGFDFSQILFKNDISKIKDEIIEKIKSFVIFIDDHMGYTGVCFVEQKQNIINVLKEYGETDTLGHFINLDAFISSDDVSYDWVYIGDFELDGDKVVEQFSKLVRKEENTLLDNLNNFEEEWYKLQKKALRICLDKEIKKLYDRIDNANKALNLMKGIFV